MQNKPRYAIACPTSMGVRITTEDRQSVSTSHLFRMQTTSAESNVLNIASSLGYECLAMTKFVAGSPISLLIQSDLRARNIQPGRSEYSLVLFARQRKVPVSLLERLWRCFQQKCWSANRLLRVPRQADRSIRRETEEKRDKEESEGAISICS